MSKSGDWSYCPACGGSIDTGYECNQCGRDWLEFHETRSALQAKLAAAERERDDAVVGMKHNEAVDKTTIQDLQQQLATAQKDLKVVRYKHDCLLDTENGLRGQLTVAQVRIQELEGAKPLDDLSRRY